jgi:hypothetical protein
MRALFYYCPITGFRVACYSDDDTADAHGSYVAVTCYVCFQIHLVNRATCEVLDEHEKEDLAS